MLCGARVARRTVKETMKVTKRQLRRIIKEELKFPDDVLVDSDSQDYQQGYADAYDGLKMQKNQSQQYQNGWDDGHFDIARDKDPTWN
jgi:hypothetical protein